MRKTIIATRGLRVLALLLTGVALTACNRGQAEEEAALAEAAATSELAVAEQRTMDIRAEAAGLVQPIATVEIKSKASGEVTNVLVESGQEVTRGTLLVQIEPRDVQNALAQAEADYEVAKARATTSKAQFDRVTQLRKANVATEQELESATLEQANSQAALIKAKVNTDLARERMNDITIRAPMDGMIIEKTVEPGVIISSASGSVSGGTTLLKMADLSIVQVRALVDQTDIGRLQAGQTARVSVEAYPSRVFEGTVIKIEPQAVVDQNVTMFPVLIQLDNSERLLKPGMNTEIEIEVARRPNAIVIPNDAVVNTRDVLTTAIALGLSDVDAQKKIDAMVELPRTVEAPMAGGQSGRQGSSGERGATPESNAARPDGAAQRGAQGAASDGDGGAGAQRGRGGQSGAQGSREGGRTGGSTLSKECQDLMAKQRASTSGGPAIAPDERTKLRACMSQMPNRGGTGGPAMGGQRGAAGRGGRAGGAAGFRPRSQNRAAVVFVPSATGPEPRNVMLGYSDLDFTEVVSGLKAGDQVYLVTAARLLQLQKENDARMRARMGGPIPGMSPVPGGQRGPGGGGPGRGN